MRRIALILAGLALLGGIVWTTVSWVGADGAVWAWSPSTGELRIPGRGIAVLPRWRFTRLPGGSLAATVRASSREGVAVDVHVEVVAPSGRLQLAPAATPAEGLVRAAGEATRGALAGVPLACLAGSAAQSSCPPDPGAGIAAAVAAVLRLPASAVKVVLAPDAEAVRRALLDGIRSSLPPGGSKVLLIGLDAVDWKLLLPFVQQGLMPNLKHLLAVGTWGEMETIVPMLSPLIWTTMATGVGADRHGILDFVEKDPATGQILPVTGRQRQVPAIWNLTSALGKPTDVVGWWATWPAERIDGTMVSDRLYFTLTQGIPKESLRGDPPDLVTPTDQTARFIALREAAQRETDWQTMRNYLSIPEAEYRTALAADRGWEDPIDGTRRIVASTRTYFEAALALASPQPDLLMVYIEGTDEIGHVLAPYEPPPQVDVDAHTAAVYAAAVPRYFAAVDAWIGKLLDACPLSRTTVLVLSDHGFKWGSDRPRNLSGTSGPTAPLWHADRAAYLIAGPGIPALGRQEKRTSVYDIAPTIAALLHIPADTHWTGRPFPVVAAPHVAALDYAPLVPPDSYRTGAGVATPVDPEYVAKLQSLGYLSGSQTAATSPQPAAPASQPAPAEPQAPAGPITSQEPAPAVEPGGNTGEATRGQLNNLGVIKINEKQYAEAEKLLRQAIELSPEYAAPHYNLRRLYMETKRYDDADRELWIAVDKGLRDRERSVDRAAADYEGLGMEDRAEALLDTALQKFPEHEPFWVHMLVVELRLDKCAEGNALGRRAAARFADSAPVHAFWGLCAACAGDRDTARKAIQRSLALNPNQPHLRAALEQLDRE